MLRDQQPRIRATSVSGRRIVHDINYYY